MSTMAFSHIAAINSLAEILLNDIKKQADQISLEEAHVLHGQISEAIGWLESTRTLLEPDGVLGT